MTVQDESATATETHGVLLTDAAASKAKALLDQKIISKLPEGAYTTVITDALK